MTPRIRTAALGMFGTGVALLLATAPTSGHHEPGAKFDPAKPITLKGSVSKIDWLNPHVHIFVEVQDAKGTASSWAVELDSTVDLRRNGWTVRSPSLGPSRRRSRSRQR